MPTTIAEQVSRLAETMAAQPPNEVMGAFTREQADLAARGCPAGVIEVGATLPDAELLDPHGATTSLYAALGRPAVGPGVLPGRLVPVLQHRARTPTRPSWSPNCPDGAWDWWRSAPRPRTGRSAPRRRTS